MDEELSSFLKALRGLIDVGQTNFPDDCQIVVTAPGKQTATVVLPCYVFSQLLKDEQ